MHKHRNWLIGLMAIGLMLVFPVITHATPTTKVLITDNRSHRVIEVDPLTKSIVWQYGTGVPGSGSNQLSSPNEAIPLTNGNIMIADTYNRRVIEVDSATKAIVWQYPPQYTPTLLPVDIKRCKDYLSGTPQDTLLITDIGAKMVREVTYPGGAVIWELSASSLGSSTDDYIFLEAEKRPGTGTPTYLITCRGRNAAVIEVERTGPSSGNITWEYKGPPDNPLVNSEDANWTPGNNVLITDPYSRRVIEVQPIKPSGGSIVWQYGPSEDYIPMEAIRIENMNTLIAGALPGGWNDGKSTDVREIEGTSTIVWSYEGTKSGFVDVEEKGIINIAKIEYYNLQQHPMPKVFAGVVVPIYQPEIIGTPTIVATKTVRPRGPQRPGATLTYTISLTNTGEGKATDISVTDRIPDGTSYISGSTGASGFSAPVTFQWSHDGGITYDDSDTTIPVTHVRWRIPYMEPLESGLLGFAVVIE